MIVGSLDMKTVEDDVIALVSSGSSEPLSHELLREAFDQAPTNPRSALLVGIAAAEVGFKGLVLELAPQTEWLVETVPSPPLVMMLREYMPRLPVKLKIDEKVPKIPDNVLGTLQNGVQARNKTTHATRSKPLDSETLKELLLTVRDLL